MKIWYSTLLMVTRRDNDHEAVLGRTRIELSFGEYGGVPLSCGEVAGVLNVPSN